MEAQGNMFFFVQTITIYIHVVLRFDRGVIYIVVNGYIV